jgi:ZIP family zinc transporter
MSLHSFLDGVVLAAALAVGGGFGLVIAAVVVIHRFSDGIAVVSLLLATRTAARDAYRWVAIVAVAPVVGVIVGVLLPPSGEVLGALLAIFAGFFLYIGAAELLPEAHRSDRSRWVVAATIAGVIAIWAFSLATGAIGVPI